MVLEAILYFALGFLCAGLITLAISPVIWNRAVTLTQRRFENSVPITVNEIQAEKDRLRAEFAMQLRRTEMELDEERSKAVALQTNLAKKRDRLNELERAASSDRETIRGLEHKSHETALRLEDKERQLSNLSDEQDKLSREYSGRLEEMSRLRDELSSADKKLAESQIAMSERDERIRKLKDRIAALGTSEDDRVEKIEALRQEVRSVKGDLKEEKAKLRRTESEKQKLVKQSERTRKKLDLLEDQPSSKPLPVAAEHAAGLAKLEEELKQERAKRIDLEMQLASEVLHAQADSERNLNGSDASLEEAKAEIASLKSQIENLKADRDAKSAPATNLSDLKAQMEDMATKMVALAASKEGPNSKIHAILNDDKTIQETSGKGDLASRMRREINREHEPAN